MRHHPPSTFPIPRLTSLLGLCLLAASAATAEEVRLSSLDLSRVQQGNGKPGLDRAVDGKPLRIAGREYAHGFGTHAPSIVHLDLQGGSTRFTAQVGINDEGAAPNKNGSVEFIIEGDGKVLWCSQLLRGGMPAQAVDLDLTGVKQLVLQVTDGFDGTDHDKADWAEASFRVSGAKPQTMAAPPTPPRWMLGEGMTTEWPVTKDQRLPHADFIEQGGLRVGQVVNYRIDAKRALSMKRSVIWPGLRKGNNGMFDGVIHHYDQREAEPVITVDGAPLGPISVVRVRLDGTLTIQGQAGQDLLVTRCAFPSPTLWTAIDRWTVRNAGKAARKVAVAPLALRHQEAGPFGLNVMEVTCTAPATTELAPGKELVFAVLFRGRLESEPAGKLDLAAEETARRAHVAALQRDLRLETPEPELDRAFAFCKLRVAEAINATRGGMMLAPGGLAYYAAAWCNDNVEYAGPFFPYLGDRLANQASLDTYRLFQKHMQPDYKLIPSSLYSEGIGRGGADGDRGDAAMYAYGCARFCLARGDRAIAAELWPAIAWCLEYSRRQTTAEGVIASDTDELEGRLPTGKANLSTSSLCYGGLRSAADLGRALGKEADARTYDQQADALAKAIDKYFGAKVEGFETYRYYAGNDVLRSWICLPLCMGLTERREGTIAALFSPRLWTADGLASQAGDLAFWDRSTLYGLRGVFQAGETATGLRYLSAYTGRRLLGEHVPYPVEAWPEGDQRHLSSESGLYCRIFTEGLFGIRPTGLDGFRCTPRLPAAWPRMALRSVRAFNRNFDVVVERRGQGQHLSVLQAGKSVAEHDLANGDSADIRLP
ncbi:MAG: NPCBM/NEW2 domain-containing protein [Verrucomicrobia bacterium]|nr:NPCBM/NEW2 domain-containing protein [Verrucomicrobiota bacterium]